MENTVVSGEVAELCICPLLVPVSVHGTPPLYQANAVWGGVPWTDTVSGGRVEHTEHHRLPTTTPVFRQYIPPGIHSNLSRSSHGSMQLSQISPTPSENSLSSNRTSKSSPQRGHSLVQCCPTERVPSGQEEAGNRNQVCNVTRRASTHLPLRHLLIHTKHVLGVWLAKPNVLHLQAALSKGQIPHLAICSPEGILLHIQSLPAQDHLIKT